MSTAGSIRIDLRYHRRSGEVRGATIGLRRPDIEKLLLGRTPEDAADLVGTLHAVCGAAHRLAAHRAIAAARACWGAPSAEVDASDLPAPSHARTTPQPLAPRERAVLLEIAQEHLTRLFIDWPEAVGLPVQPALALGWRRRMRDADPAIAPSDIDAVVRHGKTLLLAVPQTAGIGKRLSRRIRETIASLMAVNLAGRRPGKIRGFVAPAPPAAQACIGRSADQRASGFGRARTARGELVHRVLLERDGSGRETVAGWGLDAPTDRLFVNQGPVVEALEQLRAEGDAQLRQLAALTVLSFDPCFEYWLALTEVEEDDA